MERNDCFNCQLILDIYNAYIVLLGRFLLTRLNRCCCMWIHQAALTDWMGYRISLLFQMNVWAPPQRFYCCISCVADLPLTKWLYSWRVVLATYKHKQYTHTRSIDNTRYFLFSIKPFYSAHLTKLSLSLFIRIGRWMCGYVSVCVCVSNAVRVYVLEFKHIVSKTIRRSS